MSEQAKEPTSGGQAKPMPTIEKFRLFDTGNPNLLALGFETAIGSVLLAAKRKMVLEMIAKLSIAVEQMKEPS